MSENELVKEHYNQWVYPLPIDNIEKKISSGYSLIGDPKNEFELLFPEVSRKPIDILIAGCGTNQASVIAYNNPDCNVTGIDISRSSIEHSIKLKTKHNLKNLTLKTMSLYEVNRLPGTFDLIISTGVLHHLPDPVSGCRALSAALRPRGVMTIMLYGKLGRTGIYMLQKALQTLRVQKDKKSIDRLRKGLKNLPSWHPATNILSKSPDMKYDAGLVDMLLHDQDVAYSVEDIFSFIESSGMEFHCWADEAQYYLDSYVGKDFAFYDNIKMMSKIDEAIFLENFFGGMIKHSFNICRPNEAPHKFEFTPKSSKRYVPILRPEVSISNQSSPQGQAVVMLRRKRLKMMLGSKIAKFVLAIDGKKTLTEIYTSVLSSGEIGSCSEEYFMKFFEDIYRRGHIMIKVRGQ